MARAVLDEPAEAWRASAVLAALRAAGPDAVGGGAGSAPAVAWPPAEDERPSNALAAQVAGAAYAALGRLARADPSRAQRLALGLAQVRWLDESGRLVGQRAAVGGALAPVVPGAVGLGLLETVGDPAVSAARAVALAAEGERWVGERLRAIAGQGERVRSGPALSPEPPGLPIGPLLGMESSLAAWWEGAGGAGGADGAGGAGGRALVPAAGFGGLVLRDDLGTIAAGPVGLAAAASAGGSAAEAGAGGRGRWWVYLEEPAGPGVGPGAWRVTVDGREVRSGAIQRRVAGPDAASARRGVWIALPEGVGAGGGAFGLRIERLGPGGERLTWPGSAMPWAEAHTEEALIDPGAWDGLR
ncbi:MAG: hypothetical protein C0475_01125 [Planctomyces sp.]|nr:hypothetical protein [Planctomyces sp.]